MNPYLSLIGDQVEDDARAIGQRAKQLQSIKPFTVAVAEVALKGATEAIAKAVDFARMTAGLPGNAKRKSVVDHLQWHVNELKKYASTPHVPYPNAEDLKTWILEAFIQLNLSNEGREYLGNSHYWEQLYEHMAETAKASWEVAERAAAAVTRPIRAAGEFGEKLSKLPENLLKIPWYVWVMLAAPAAYVAFRVLTTPSMGSAIATRFLKR